MEKSIYTIEFIKQAILDDTRAYLMTPDITVDVQETKLEDDTECISVGILIGGLSYSFTCPTDDIQTTFEVALKMLHAQLVLYAVECLKNEVKAKVPPAYVPEYTSTFIKNNTTQATQCFAELAGVVNSFNIFDGTFYDKND